MRFAGYTLTYRGERAVRQPQRSVFIAEIGATKDGKAYGVLHPSVNVYPSAPNDPIGTPN